MTFGKAGVSLFHAGFIEMAFYHLSKIWGERESVSPTRLAKILRKCTTEKEEKERERE